MLTPKQRVQLASGATNWNLALDEATLDKFSRFAELLAEANRHLNLTRISQEDIVPLHFLDSLALTTLFQPAPETRILDVGTGAGFPGIPLALVFPESQFCLLDGTQKRLNFLDAVIGELQLKNARTLHGRAEEIARLRAHRSHYDLVTARAVAKMPALAEWMLPLVRPGGVAIAYKSREIAEELTEAGSVIARLGGKVERTAEVALPDTEIIRKLVVIRKPMPESRSMIPVPDQRRRR